jgi:O-antigen/teichoic acid export membrane protein
MSYKVFYNVEIRNNLNSVEYISTKEILKSIYPNALKLGLTGIGSFLVSRSSIIIGSLFLNLNEIASYGITVQFITVISALAGIYLATYMPSISHLRVLNHIEKIREIYIKGELVLIFTFFFGGVGLLVTGEWLLNQIGSNTHLVSPSILFITLIVTFLEANHSAAGTLLVTKNEVPFFKASLLSGAFTVCLLFLFLYFFKFSVISLVLAPGLAQMVYQNWKWPLEVKRDLGITTRSLFLTFIKK